LLRERLGPTSEYVQSLIDIQAAYINTNHPDFMKNTSINAGSQHHHGSNVQINGSSDQRRVRQASSTLTVISTGSAGSWGLIRGSLPSHTFLYLHFFVL
jgi:dynamin 1-like protein